MVPTLHADVGLTGLLESLRAQVGCAPFETVVVFDGTAPEAVDELGRRFPWVRCLRRSHAGSAAARNLGAFGLENGLLVFVDADMTCDPDFVAAHQRAHEGQSRRVVIGQFPTETSRSSFFKRVSEEWTTGWMAAMSGPARFDTVCSGNMSIGTATFGMVHGFSSAFDRWGRADSELGVRLIDAGAEVVVERVPAVQRGKPSARARASSVPTSARWVQRMSHSQASTPRFDRTFCCRGCTGLPSAAGVDPRAGDGRSHR